MNNELCDPKAIKDQLNRTEGQVMALKKMYETKRSCAELLQQIVAARASLSRLGTMLLEAEAQGCMGVDNELKIKELKHTISQLFKIT